VPESLLTILKLCALALLYLFFLRVLRAVWAEMQAPSMVGAPGAAERAARTAAPRDTRSSTKLAVVEPSELRGRTYGLGEELTVGRAAGCQVTLDDSYVSQLHARIFRRDGVFYVEDLGSTNGTFLNTQKVSAPVAMKRGDRLKIGSTVMELTS
jgi:pSer/pThr/pTyr-binding forkhead associated (FHA) protein